MVRYALIIVALSACMTSTSHSQTALGQIEADCRAQYKGNPNQDELARACVDGALRAIHGKPAQNRLKPTSELFTTSVLAEATKIARRGSCENECELKVGKGFTLQRIVTGGRAAAYLMVTEDQGFCGSAGCSSAVLAEREGQLQLVQEGLGITLSNATTIALRSGAASTGTKIPPLKVRFEQSHIEGVWAINCSTGPFDTYIWTAAGPVIRASNATEETLISDIMVLPDGNLSLVLRGQPNAIRPKGLFRQITRLIGNTKQVIYAKGDGGPDFIKDGRFVFGNEVNRPTLLEYRCAK